MDCTLSRKSIVMHGGRWDVDVEAHANSSEVADSPTEQPDGKGLFLFISRPTLNHQPSPVIRAGSGDTSSAFGARLDRNRLPALGPNDEAFRAA